MNATGTQPIETETAYVEVNDNDVEYSVVISENVIADVDDYDNLVGLQLLSLKELPTVDEIESYVDIEWGDEDILEEALWELGAYNRIQQAFGN